MERIGNACGQSGYLEVGRGGKGVEGGGGWRVPYSEVVMENGRRSRVYVKTPGRTRISSIMSPMMMNSNIDPPSPLFLSGGRKVLSRSSITYSRTSRARIRSGYRDYSNDRDALSDLDGPMDDDSDSDEEWALMQSSDSDSSLASPSATSPSSTCSDSSSYSDKSYSSSSSSSSSSVILQPDLVSTVVRAVGPVFRLFLSPAFFTKRMKSQCRKKNSGGGGSGNGNNDNESAKKEKKRVKGGGGGAGAGGVDGCRTRPGAGVSVKRFSSSFLSF
ncbi:hypothetical protein CBR_g49565 [Chara braunii]|uniref:Uncharacterized protein n=1 Tax=Chara braunii TaxID=69332 RepID=A0A388M5G7_CHABU|nr:hypothetical protein CBR_g49565 [Chara braunii]|eukprot:GBG89712.1 hypothetical protein CBR_g49565 [Chara braunii]